MHEMTRPGPTTKICKDAPCHCYRIVHFNKTLIKYKKKYIFNRCTLCSTLKCIIISCKGFLDRDLSKNFKDSYIFNQTFHRCNLYTSNDIKHKPQMHHNVITSKTSTSMLCTLLVVIS